MQNPTFLSGLMLLFIAVGAGPGCSSTPTSTARANENERVARPIVLSTGQFVEFALPKNWGFSEIKGPAHKPPIEKAIRFKSVTGAKFQLHLYLIPRVEDNFDQAGQLERQHEIETADFIAGSVEKKNVLHQLTLSRGRGLYSTLTDPSLVGKPIAADDFLTVTPFTIYLGERVLVTAKLVCDDTKSPEFNAGLDVVRSLRVGK